MKNRSRSGLQSCFIFCYENREDAEKNLDKITDYSRTHPVPIQCYAELAATIGHDIPYPFWLGVLFAEEDEARADEWLSKIGLTADEVCCGVDRATEFNLYSTRIKVKQFWEDETYQVRAGE